MIPMGVLFSRYNDYNRAYAFTRVSKTKILMLEGDISLLEYKKSQILEHIKILQAACDEVNDDIYKKYREISYESVYIPTETVKHGVDEDGLFHPQPIRGVNYLL